MPRGAHVPSNTPAPLLIRNYSYKRLIIYSPTWDIAAFPCVLCSRAVTTLERWRTLPAPPASCWPADRRHKQVWTSTPGVWRQLLSAVTGKTLQKYQLLKNANDWETHIKVQVKEQLWFASVSISFSVFPWSRKLCFPWPSKTVRWWQKTFYDHPSLDGHWRFSPNIQLHIL